jgi:excisionase family DNA binding protein
VDEVAVYFAISMRTVYRLLDEGDLIGTKIRGCLRVSAEEIIRYEEALGENKSNEINDTEQFQNPCGTNPKLFMDSLTISSASWTSSTFL